MNYFSMLNALAAALFLLLGMFAIRQDFRSRTNRLFALTSLCFALWAFSFAFMHASTDRGDIERWYDISAPGWCLYSALSLHFILSLLKRDALLRKAWFYAVTYLPGLVLIAREVTGSLAAIDFIRVGPGYSESNPIGDPWYWFFLLYQTGIAGYGLIILFRWGMIARLKRERMQALLVAVPAAVCLVLSFVSDILLPAFRMFAVPALSPLFILIWACGSWIAITRYRLMAVSIQNASDEIVKRMKDVLFLVDLDMRILKTNPQIAPLLGIDEKIVLGRPLYVLVQDRDGFIEAFDDMVRNNVPLSTYETDLLAARGDPVPANITLSMVRDRFGDPAGIVVIGTDIREQRQLLSTLRELADAEETLRKRNKAIEKDLLSAQIIQRALLPHAVPVHRRIVADFRSVSMDAVGGDYFAFTHFPGGELGVFIGDVSGHGVSAALFLSLLKSEYDRACSKHGLAPGAFLSQLNNELVNNMPHYFITGVYGYFSFGVNGAARFTCATGGHPNPLHHRPSTGELQFLPCHGPLVGKFKDLHYGETAIDLVAGDRLFLYTDGLVEARNAAGEMLGFPKLHELISDTGGRSLPMALDEIMRQLGTFRGSRSAEDDMVIIGFEVR